MKIVSKVYLRKRPANGELRYIVTKIWGLDVDFGMMRENGYIDRFYDDVIKCLTEDVHPESFAEEWGFADGCDAGEMLEYWTAPLWFNTIKYLYLKGFIFIRK